MSYPVPDLRGEYESVLICFFILQFISLRALLDFTTKCTGTLV